MSTDAVCHGRPVVARACVRVALCALCGCAGSAGRISLGLTSPAQEVIALHDLDRGTRMKITEPKTPFHAPGMLADGGELCIRELMPLGVMNLRVASPC